MARRPARRPATQIRHQTYTPPSAPELFFKGDQAEPDEVAAFREALQENPGAVKQALEAWYHDVAIEIPEHTIVCNIIASEHWSTQPSGIGVDRTTEEVYIAGNQAAFETIGAMDMADPRYPSAQQELRATVLYTLASRAIDASMGVVYRA